MIFGTVSSAGHLPRAMVMARSVKEHMPESKVVIGIIEDTMPLEAAHCPYFDEAVLVKNMTMYPSYRKFFFQYRAKEAAGSSKAQVMKYIYDKYADEQLLVYMDSDMKVMSPLTELSAIAENHPVIITGHHINPDQFDYMQLPDFQVRGIYNSGFLAFKRHPVAEKYLNWWGKLCERNGYIEPGVYTDQVWLDLAHNYFDDVYALRHPGYNVGPWNIEERWNIDREGSKAYTIDGSALRCVHFASNFLEAASWIDESKGCIYNDIYNEYAEELEEMGQSRMSKIPWSYSFFTSGEQIADKAKTAYRKHYYDNPEIDNPFSLSNSFFMEEAGNSKGNKGAAPQPLKRGKKTRLKTKNIALKRLRSKRQKQSRAKRP